MAHHGSNVSLRVLYIYCTIFKGSLLYRIMGRSLKLWIFQHHPWDEMGIVTKCEGEREAIQEIHKYYYCFNFI